MKKWIFSLAMIFTASLSQSPSQNMLSQEQSLAPGKFIPSDVSYLGPESVQTGVLTVKGMQIDGFTGAGLDKIQTAFHLLEMVVNSEEFKDRVINFKNTKGERSFASNKGMTNEEIYQTFMEGRETLQPETPGEMNFYLRLYNRPWSKVIGYTTGDTNVININWKFFKNFKASDVAGNLAHEWTHKIGFDHKSAAEHDSAPYAIGYIVDDLAEKFSQKMKLH